jgi:exodeoxyribonuclease V beta subunit
LWQDLLIKYQSFPEEQEAEYSLYHAVAEWLQEILSTPLYQGFV